MTGDIVEFLFWMVACIICVPIIWWYFKRRLKKHAEMLRKVAEQYDGKFIWGWLEFPHFLHIYKAIEIEISYSPRNMYIADCGHAIIKLPKANLPHTFIAKKSGLSILPIRDLGLSLKKAINTNQADFDKIYYIKSKNKDFAKSFIDRDIQQAMLSQRWRAPCISINDDMIGVEMKSPIEIEDYVQLLKFAKKICDKLKNIGISSGRG